MAVGSALFMAQSVRHSLASLLRLGPSYSVLVMQHTADKGLHQVRQSL
jgi:hypothetical protein